ncbi:MAG: hypothetical protein HYV35_00010 [Lentisphaerae bacterium]|nr:hypothetical protein [Lentisphaerota bacterium]
MSRHSPLSLASRPVNKLPNHSNLIKVDQIERELLMGGSIVLSEPEGEENPATGKSREEIKYYLSLAFLFLSVILCSIHT